MVLASNYVGVIQFGTEQKHATENVTFEVTEFSLNATRGTPKEADAPPSGPPRVEAVYVLVVILATINIWFI